jgi:tetratricopeptide (TPR) repeat protein
VTWLIACVALWIADDGSVGARDSIGGRAAYAQGLEAYHRGDLAAAASAFALLAQANAELRPLALFALGNVKFRLAMKGGADGDAARLYREAIGHYRRVLDEPPSDLFSRDDALFNLELAKRQLPWQETPSDRPTVTPPDTRPSPAKEKGSPAPSPASKSKPSEEEAGSKAEKDVGEVRRPTAGMEFVDAPPLSAEEALEKLTAAVQRLRIERAKSRSTRRSSSVP